MDDVTALAAGTLIEAVSVRQGVDQGMMKYLAAVVSAVPPLAVLMDGPKATNTPLRPDAIDHVDLNRSMGAILVFRSDQEMMFEATHCLDSNVNLPSRIAGNPTVSHRKVATSGLVMSSVEAGHVLLRAFIGTTIVQLGSLRLSRQMARHSLDLNRPIVLGKDCFEISNLLAI